MNASCFSRCSKRAVLHPQHAAARVADVVEASLLARFFAVRGSGKVRPFAAKQSGSLLRFGLFGRYRTKSSLANFFASFWCADVLAVFGKHIRVAVSQMLSLSNALKIFDAVVRLVSVDVVNLLLGVKSLKPALRHNSVHESLTTKAQIPAGMFGGYVRQELSKNFPASAYGIQMVKEAVLNAIDYKASHIAPSGVVKESGF